MKLWTLSKKAQYYKDQRRPVAERDAGRPMTDYEMDFWCFNRLPWGHAERAGFLIRAMQHQWGERIMFEQTINGVRYENFWATRIIRECLESPIVDLMGAGSSGKTHMTTCYVYTVWKSVPYHTSAYLSTTTGEGADARSWATIQQIYRDDQHRYGKLINSTRTLVIEENDPISEENAKFRDLRNAIKCVLIPTGNEGRNVVATISGRKNNRVLWQCDEFPHMDIGVLAGRTNLLTNRAAGGWAQFIGCGNGPKDGDPMFIDAEPERGWPSVNKDEHWKWTTRSGVCLYFNGDKSPNMQVPEGTPAPFPRIADREVRALILKNCWNDENTPEFYTQWYGFPPSVMVADTVMTDAFLTNGGAYQAPEWGGTPRKCFAGLDLGFRHDGDPCVLHFGLIGRDVRGKNILAAEPDGIPLPVSAVSKDEFNSQIAKKVVEKCRERDCHDLALDVTGDGGILLQAIERQAREENYVLHCVPVSFSGAAEDRVVIPGEKRTGNEMFANMVAQIWSSARVCVGNSVVRGLSQRGQAVSQLCKRKFATDEKKRFTVEKKKDMKKRIKRSPDHADAFCLLIYLALKNGLSGADLPPKKPTWDKVMQKKSEQPSRYSSHSQQRTAYTTR